MTWEVGQRGSRHQNLADSARLYRYKIPVVGDYFLRIPVASSCSYSRCAEQWRSTKKELSLRATTATGGIASHRPPAPVAVRRGASRLLLAGVGVWLTCDAPLHLAQLNGRHAGPAGWLPAGCWLPCLCNRIPYRCWLETAKSILL